MGTATDPTLSYIDSDFVRYEHHGNNVAVRRGLKGRHREHCLCGTCSKFNPGMPEGNCPIANLVYAVCLAQGLVLPVWECPDYERKYEGAA